MSESHQEAHEVGGRAPGGRAPHPREQGVGPLAFIFGDDFYFIYFKIFRGVSGLLELRRIGFQYLLVFQPRIPAAGILHLHVNLVK